MTTSRPKKLPVVLTTEETKRLLAKPNRRYPTGLRNYTIMAVMYRAGLRVSEAISLEPQHIDSKRNQILVKGGKGDKDRTIPVEPWLIDTLNTWLAKRYQLPKVCKNIFTTLQGEPLNDRYIRAMVKREAQAAGIDKDVHPHTLRHTYATELLEDGFTIREVQELMGHADISTTMIYTHVNPVHVAEKIARRRMA